MPKIADTGSKRLVSLAPTPWVRWLTGDATLQVVEFLSEEFQWVSRVDDILIKVQSATHGTFLVVNEIQLRPDANMAYRMRAYTALVEERYRLPVFPVLVNILPPPATVHIVSQYHSEFMGLMAHQDYKVINLWEVDVNVVFDQNLVTLLPFVPILKGGDDHAVLNRAVTQLRTAEDIAELEPLLAFFASFVLQSEVVQEIMRWDMAILRESPWYKEILDQGVERGLEQGIKQGQKVMLLQVLTHRFGVLAPEVVDRISDLDSEQLSTLVDVVLEADSLSAVLTHLDTLTTNGG